MCPHLPCNRGSNSSSAAWRWKKKQMEPVPAQMPPSILPFRLSFFHFPWLFMNSAITCANYAWAGPPEVAVGSTLGQLQLAGHLSQGALGQTWNFKAEGILNVNLCSHILYSCPPFKRHIFSHLHTWALSLNL